MNAMANPPQRADDAGQDQPDSSDTTHDAFLGGRLMLRQPKKGHRAGHDAILLAAFCRAQAGDIIADLGAGIGTAGLALACRVDRARVTLIEREPDLVQLAQDNIAGNGMAARVRAFRGDVETCGIAQKAAGETQDAAAFGSFDHVMMNPPYNDPARHRASKDMARAQAHMREASTLAIWIRAAKRLLKPKGEITLIWRADGMADVLAELDSGFGGVCVLPVHASSGDAAIRVLVRAVLGSRAPLSIMPGLYLRDREGQPSFEAESILRHACATAHH